MDKTFSRADMRHNGIPAGAFFGDLISYESQSYRKNQYHHRCSKCTKPEKVGKILLFFPQ
jgi:hypothetical protein